MRSARLLVLVCGLVLMSASPAHAARGFWAWLEELSGPGPFYGFITSVPLVCWRGGEVDEFLCEQFTVKRRLDDKAKKPIDKSLVLNFGRLSSGNALRFKNPDGRAQPDRREVVEWPVYGTFMFRPHLSLELGPGAGAVIFSGDNVGPTRFVVLPIMGSWKPLLTRYGWDDKPPRWRRVVSVDFQMLVSPTGVTGADFGAAANPYRKGRTRQGSVWLTLDITELLFR